MSNPPKRLIIAISGASGAIMGIRTLEVLQSTDIETHLLVSHAARATISLETDWKVSDVFKLADHVYSPENISAPVASGSFTTMGMIVIPCSIKTLSSIANSYAATIISRAADVVLKEGRKLILVVRESPLHVGHLRLMTRAAESGAVIFPPVPAFYAGSSNLDEMVNNMVGRILARIGIENNQYVQWKEPESS